MVKMIANELRVIQEDLSLIKEFGVDLKLPDIESFKFILPGLHILPVKDPLLEQVVEGVPQLDVEVARGRQDEDVGALGEYSEQC